MAYMNQQKKVQLAPGIKAVLKKYGLKGSISVKNHSTLRVTISQGKIDFLKGNNDTYRQVNEYCIESSFRGVARQCMLELKQAMNVGNHNRSDTQSDYFDVGWYIDICVGQWDKPYKLIRGLK